MDPIDPISPIAPAVLRRERAVFASTPGWGDVSQGSVDLVVGSATGADMATPLQSRLPNATPMRNGRRVSGQRLGWTPTTAGSSRDSHDSPPWSVFEDDEEDQSPVQLSPLSGPSGPPTAVRAEPHPQPPQPTALLFHERILREIRFDNNSNVMPQAAVGTSSRHHPAVTVVPPEADDSSLGSQARALDERHRMNVGSRHDVQVYEGSPVGVRKTNQAMRDVDVLQENMKDNMMEG